MVYLTPEYVSLDTTFLVQVQKSVGKDRINKKPTADTPNPMDNTVRNCILV